MRTTSLLYRTVLVAAGLLAISASAAQAMPTRQSSDTAAQAVATGSANAPEHDPLGAAKAVHQLQVVSESPGAPVVFHRSGFVLGHQLNSVPAQPMAAAVDSPTDQTVPLVISQPVPVVTAVSASSGFDWTDAGIGAAVAALLLILAGIAATRVRPRQTATL